MKQLSFVSKTSCHWLAGLSLLALAVLFAPDARACGAQPGPAGIAAAGLLALQVQNSASLPEGQTASPENEEQASAHRHPRIVGMWILNFYAGKSSEAWDVAMEQFYADGNEMTNDIASAPATGNVCWGTWEQVANRKFKLKHLGWNFDPNGTFLGPFELTATVEVDNDGDSFTGTYVADTKDLSGHITWHSEGVLKATRFKID